MDIYFVRHGQTAANKAHRHQSGDTPLTELGHKQAQAVGIDLKDKQPTRIICSPYTRAQQTAEAIAAELQLPITRHESLVELKRPAYLMGRLHFGLSSLWYMVQWFFAPDNPHWRESGAESYLEFIERIHYAREYLESFEQHERIVVVSHSIFINFFVQHVCDREPMNVFSAALRLLKIRTLDNSSITHLKYEKSDFDNVCTWHLEQFDDDAHVVT